MAAAPVSKALKRRSVGEDTKGACLPYSESISALPLALCVSQGLRQEEVFSFDSSRYDLRGRLGIGPSMPRQQICVQDWRPGFWQRLCWEFRRGFQVVWTYFVGQAGPMVGFGCFVGASLALERFRAEALLCASPPPFSAHHGKRMPRHTTRSDCASVAAMARFSQTGLRCNATRCRVCCAPCYHFPFVTLSAYYSCYFG